jgi:two-component system NarL family response regulator
VDKAIDGREAVELWKRHRPDVTLLDLRMPQLGGVGAVAEMRALNAAARVIILTAFDTGEDVYRGIQAGALGYLRKDASRTELLHCIRKVHGGEICLPPAIASMLAKRLGDEELTSRETEVLLLLARGASNKDIGRTLFISETTVKSHVKAIFAKLKVLSRTEAAAAASHRGLVRF